MHPSLPASTRQGRPHPARFLRAILVLALLVPGAAGLGTWAWNHSMPALFALPPLTLPAALSLTILLVLLRALVAPGLRWRHRRDGCPSRPSS